MATEKRNIIERALHAITPTAWRNTPVAHTPVQKPSAIFGFNGTYNHIFSVGFDGEKSPGQMGTPKDYYLDIYSLRIRSRQAYLENEIAKTVIDKAARWIISSGLKLQCNPDEVVLASEGVNIKKEAFNEITERRFAVWARSKTATFNAQQSFNKLARMAYRESKLVGDVLVILRVQNGWPTVELVDTNSLITPPGELSNPLFRNGVEVDERGRHIAYHIRRQLFDTLWGYQYERVEAYSAKTGLRLAYLVYGSEFRIGDTRGLPVIAVVLETLQKLERYKTATVSSAEEVAKNPYQITHDQNSTGESPLDVVTASILSNNGTDNNGEAALRELITKITSTTNNQVYNMPIGAKMEGVEYKGTLSFADFYNTNADKICGVVNIPPNVAFSIYNDSFSASRAATKDWEHTMDTEREDFGEQFYQPIYALLTYLELLKGKIPAPGLLEFYRTKNQMGIDAYLAFRVTGPKFPHIDPLKEVKAERAKLGPLFDNVPLTTLEAATEALSGGDGDSNMQQAGEELTEFRRMNLEPPAPQN